MSAELSRMITGLQKVGASVVQSGKIHYRKVAGVLDDRVEPVLAEGQPKPDFEALQLGLVSLLESELGKVLAYDETHVAELDDDREQLKERREAYPELLDILTGIQKACEGVYSEASSVKLFGNVRLLPQDPVELHRVGMRVHSRLEDPTYEIPGEPRLPGWQLSDRIQLASGLKRPVDRLGRALEELGAERKSSDGTLLEKRLAIEGFGRTIRFGSACLASLYSLAGFDELAAKVRPKRRAPRRRGGSEPADPRPAPETAPEASASGDDGAEIERPKGPTLVVS